MLTNLLGGVYAKLIGVALVLLALLALWLWGHHVGAAGVQAKWDADKIVQKAAAAEAALQARATEDNQRSAFNALAAKYEEATHAPTPSVADATADAVRAGTVQLRNEPASCPIGAVSAATARSRAADAAATQALADRVQHSLDAIRIGDAADKREHDLDEQILGLQAILRIERQPSPTP